MPSKKRPGKVGRYVELPEQLNAQLVAFCDAAGVGVAAVVREAIARHLRFPPPPPTPAPFPELPSNQQNRRARKKANG
jgi:hypothetical protein